MSKTHTHIGIYKATYEKIREIQDELPDKLTICTLVEKIIREWETYRDLKEYHEANWEREAAPPRE